MQGLSFVCSPQLDVVEFNVRKGNRQIDAILQMPHKGKQLLAEIKKWATHANLGAIITQIQEFAPPDEGLLITDYVNPNMARKLREAGIQYIDEAGNAYLNQPPVYIHITGKPKARTTARTTAGKAFQSAGMKIVCAFLKDNELINGRAWGQALHFTISVALSNQPMLSIAKRSMTLPELKTVSLFLITALAEILGCYLPYLWLREGKTIWLLVPGALSLAAFVWLLSLHPTAAGRVYAAYGGVYIFMAIMWLWTVDGIRPTVWDMVGTAVALTGMAIIMFAPRAT